MNSIQGEINERLGEIDRVSAATQFNGKHVLGKDAGKLNIQVGANDGEKITIELKKIDAKELDLNTLSVESAPRGVEVAGQVAQSRNILGAANTGTGYGFDASVNVALADAGIDDSAGKTLVNLKNSDGLINENALGIQVGDKVFAASIAAAGTNPTTSPTVVTLTMTTGNVTIDGGTPTSVASPI